MADDEDPWPDADASEAPRRRRRAVPTDDPPVSAAAPGQGPSIEQGATPTRRGQGPRAQRRRAERRARRRRRFSTVLGAVVGVLGVAALFLVVGPRIADTVAGWAGDDDPDPVDSAPPVDGDVVAPAQGRRTVLLATVDETTGERATHIQLLTVNGDDGTTAIVLVPPSIITDVPGYGLIPLADAGGVGGVTVLELALENALDITIDAGVEMTRSSWAALFSRAGTVEVTVREAIDAPVAGGGSSRRFEPGPQALDGPRLAELLTVEVDGESELAALPRAQEVLVGFLDEVGADMDAVFEDGAPMLDSAAPDVVEQVLRSLGTASVDDRLDVFTLPVEPIGAGDDVVYQIDERGRELARDLLGAGEATERSAVEGVRLEVLNGNGRVGVGQEVAALLVPLGHQIVITGNAENFDQPETLVTVRGDDDELLAAAQEIRRTLGVGRVTVSTIPSTTVDISIVVGADWTG